MHKVSTEETDDGLVACHMEMLHRLPIFDNLYKTTDLCILPLKNISARNEARVQETPAVV